MQYCVLFFVTLCEPCLCRESSIDMEKSNFWSEMQFRVDDDSLTGDGGGDGGDGHADDQ